MNIKLAIFDFDGTLCDTRAPIIAAKQETMRIYGLPVRDEAACASTIGYTAKEGFQRLFPGIEEKLLENCVATYRRLFEEMKQTTPPTLFPGVAETLEKLAARGITCTIATARNQVSCHEMLEGLGIKQFFSAGKIFGGNGGFHEVSSAVKFVPGAQIFPAVRSIFS